MVRLQITETHWIFELFVLEHCGFGGKLFLDVEIEVFDEVLHFSLEDGLELGVDFWVEVVEPVDEAPEIALEGPAVPAFGEEVDEGVEGVALDELADVDLVGGVDERGQNLEEGADVGQFGAHHYFLGIAVLLLVLLDELVEVGLGDEHHDVGIGVVLHDLEDLYLVGLECPAVAVDEVPEEVEQFGLVVAVFRFVLDVFADLGDELEDGGLVVEHGLVVVVHLLEEVDAADVALDVVDHLGDVPLHQRLYLVEVLDQRHDEVVRQVQQLYRQLALRELLAREDEVEHLQVQVRGVDYLLLHPARARSLAREVDQPV